MIRKTATKKKVAPISAGSRNVLENQMFGKEPAFPIDTVLTDTELIKAYNWYNYMKERSDATTYIRAYFDKRDPVIRKRLDNNVCQYLLTSYCWAARMIDNGTRLPDGLEDRIREHVKQTIEKYGKNAVEHDSPSVERVRGRDDSTITVIEQFLDNGEPFSTYDYLSKNSIPKLYAQKIADYYRPILNELSEAITTKDKQLKEAYRHMTVKSLRSLAAVYQSILDDCDRYLENKKIARKPRKKKAVSVEKKLANFQYMEKSDEYKVVSVSPHKIIGAKEIWLFNVRYKTISRLVSSTGFDIKGTTILNVDITGSKKKTTGRKSNDVVNQVLNSGKIQLRKLMDTIKGVESEPSGRINKDVLVLRIQ